MMCLSLTARTNRLKLLRYHFKGQWRNAGAGVAGQGSNLYSSSQDSMSES